MSDTERLASIQANVNRHGVPGGIAVTPSDVAFLLDLARKQQARIERTLSMVSTWEELGTGENVSVQFAVTRVREALEAKL